jgi:sporulation protein YlmC with PRC-barrel domain
MISFRKLSGKKVVTADAKNVGEIDGGYIDTESWKVTHLVVELNDEAIELFGYKKPRIPMIGNVSVCLPITAVKTAGDFITLNITFEDLPSLPIDQCKM